MNAYEQAVLRGWFDAYDPAVHADVTQHEIVVRSCRRHRGEVVRIRRSPDLLTDLNAALAELVYAIS